jgi:pimeloyl-ACP methyl ester carboxylesterase
MTRRRWILLALVALLLGAAFAGCSPLADRLLLYPPSGDRDLGGAERVMIADAGGAIETIRVKSPAAKASGAKSIVLRFYGNADRADAWPAEEAASFEITIGSAVEVWGVNYPGFGRSEGSATLDGVARAADVAFVEAQKRGLPIFVVGTSMGTTAALHLAAEHDVRGVLLQNPPPLPQLIRGRYGWWNLWLVAAPLSWCVPSSLDSLDNARRTKAPTIVVSSEDDEVVPFDYQTDVFDACAGPKARVMVPGAKHNDPIPPDKWTEIAVAMTRLGRQ